MLLSEVSQREVKNKDQSNMEQAHDKADEISESSKDELFGKNIYKVFFWPGLIAGMAGKVISSFTSHMAYSTINEEYLTSVLPIVMFAGHIYPLTYWLFDYPRQHNAHGLHPLSNIW